MKRIYEQLPGFYKERVNSEAAYADIDEPAGTVITGMLVTAVIAVVGAYLLPWDWRIRAAIGAITAILGAPALPYLWISLAAERRKSQMDRILPDALNLVSANMKSGHTIEKAFLMSARDEFGPLAEELQTTAMQMYGGTPVNTALKNMEARVKSELFQETIKLLVDGIESGGNTAELLRSSANDIRSSIEIREEIKSSIRMYMVFIIIAAVFGAPILFSISVFMAETTTHMWQDSGIGEFDQAGQATSQLDIGLNLQFQAPQVDIEFFSQFAIMAIIMTNIFSALIISEIQNGNAKQGAKYIPVFIIISLVLFFTIGAGLSSALAGF